MYGEKVNDNENEPAVEQGGVNDRNESRPTGAESADRLLPKEILGVGIGTWLLGVGGAVAFLLGFVYEFAFAIARGIPTHLITVRPESVAVGLLSLFVTAACVVIGYYFLVHRRKSYLWDLLWVAFVSALNYAVSPTPRNFLIPFVIALLALLVFRWKLRKVTYRLSRLNAGRAALERCVELTRELTSLSESPQSDRRRVTQLQKEVWQQVKLAEEYAGSSQRWLAEAEVELEPVGRFFERVKKVLPAAAVPISMLLVFSHGQGAAVRQTDFMVYEDPASFEEMVVLRSYGDVAVAAILDREGKTVGPGYKVVKLDEVKQLRHEWIGRLDTAKPAVVGSEE